MDSERCDALPSESSPLKHPSIAPGTIARCAGSTGTRAYCGCSFRRTSFTLAKSGPAVSRPGSQRSWGVHAAGGALTRSYSPGLISAFVLYVPLGSLALMRAFDQASRAQLARGIVAGVLLHIAVFIVAYAFTTQV